MKLPETYNPMAVPKIKSEKEVTKFLKMNALDAQSTERRNKSQP